MQGHGAASNALVVANLGSAQAVIAIFLVLDLMASMLMLDPTLQASALALACKLL